MTSTIMLNDIVLHEFDVHATRLREAARARRDFLLMRPVVMEIPDASAEATIGNGENSLGVPIRGETMAGDTNLRTLRTLLSIIDDRGFERSAHQVQFHSAFERSTARVIYKRDWASSRSQIMAKNGWTTCSSEVLISTPRRFGKTFACVQTNTSHCIHQIPTRLFHRRIAIFAACLALSFGCEIVVFSPARRASRKLLERMVELVLSQSNPSPSQILSSIYAMQVHSTT